MKQSKNDARLGRFLSLILRHHPEAAGITLDAHGWADVGALLRGICDTGWQIDRETLERHHKEEDILKRRERREVFEDWVGTSGPEPCHKAIDDFWNGR